jgi:hypothetical protein
MKKAIILLATAAAFASCTATTTGEDTQMLQKKYEHVYRISAYRYITFDSAHVYDVTVTSKGWIESAVKIK